jgi:penicillin V acylase-like amidase (Ntn superfamily)
MKHRLTCSLLSAALMSSSAYACSNIAISTKGDTVVARTLDFEENTGNVFALGRTGQANVSNTNLSPKAIPAQWVNQYSYMGQTSFNGPNILDGMNSAGVYVGYLYLPGVTQYPHYNPSISKPALGITDMANYILGTARSVKEALAELKTVQLVANVTPIYPNKTPGIYGYYPIHLVIRDNSGASAAIEFIKGRAVVVKDAGNVFTNSPDMNWQKKNAATYNYVGVNNTNKKYDDLYMNGSGFNGIPGDWTPPSRFARATQLIKNMPAAHTDAQSMDLALQAINSVIVPLGTNPSPTIWVSMADLKTHHYYFKSMYTVINSKTHLYQAAPKTINAWQDINLDAVVAGSHLPKGWISAQLTNRHAPIKKIINAMAPTSGKMNPAPVPHFEKEITQ